MNLVLELSRVDSVLPADGRRPARHPRVYPSPSQFAEKRPGLPAPREDHPYNNRAFAQAGVVTQI
jgi:hypothetical protein